MYSRYEYMGKIVNEDSTAADAKTGKCPFRKSWPMLQATSASPLVRQGNHTRISIPQCLGWELNRMLRAVVLPSIRAFDHSI